MFSRLSSNILVGLSTRRCLPNSSHPSLRFSATLSHPTITQAIRLVANKPDYKPESSSSAHKPDNSEFLDNPKRTTAAYQSGILIADYNPKKSATMFRPKPEKTSGRHAKLRDLCKYAFDIGSTVFIFNVMERNKDKEIILALDEFNKETKHHRHIWVSIFAAKILLDKLKAYQVKTTDNPSVAHFTDTKMNRSIGFKLVNKRNMFLKIESKHLVENKGSAIFIPLEGISMFDEKLASVLQKFEKLNDPNRQVNFEDLENRTFVSDPNRYFLNLSRDTMTNEIIVIISEFNKINNRKREMRIQIEAAQLLFHRLKDCCDVIQSYEGRLQRWKQSLDVIFSKSCMDQEYEYIVQVLVSQPETHHLVDMFLTIQKQNRLNENKKSYIIIRSHGAPLLLHNLEEILREYQRLKPSLLEADSSTLAGPKTPKAAYVFEDEQSPNVKMLNEAQECPPKLVDRPTLTESETLKSNYIHEEPQDSLKFVNPKNLDSERDQPKETSEQYEMGKVQEKQGSLLKLGLGVLLLVVIFLW